MCTLACAMCRSATPRIREEPSRRPGRLRYDYSPRRDRLALDDGNAIKVYETGGSAISGFSTNHGKTLSFDIEDDSRKISSLRLIGP